MDLSKFEALFGEPNVESTVHTPFLFQVHAPDPCHLRVVVTDFLSTTFEAIRSIQQLDDMRDETGVGGSWSDFLEYLVNSLNFGDVKLVFDGQSKSAGPGSARLVAQKSKGMPRISVSLRSLLGTAANEAIASFLSSVEQGTNYYLAEKSEHLQKQLDGLVYSNRHTSQKIHDKLTSDTSAAATLYGISDKQSDQNPSPMKAPKRVVPAHRRSKVRGVLLQDTEDD
ncbi:hypothetical protein M8C21_012907 [Ambrosia artemisiifolia]|uniref:Uncharacterized protein n=1 Tax=Ambrosia artemisiifolia TaxID=4212 RepID=A0AAD5CGR2_AMBAR|nr:hypothetical protein M8C21_012907 [Ambrosia artemisiifolia]